MRKVLTALSAVVLIAAGVAAAQAAEKTIWTGPRTAIVTEGNNMVGDCHRTMTVDKAGGKAQDYLHMDVCSPQAHNSVDIGCPLSEPWLCRNLAPWLGQQFP